MRGGPFFLRLSSRNAVRDLPTPTQNWAMEIPPPSSRRDDAKGCQVLELRHEQALPHLHHIKQISNGVLYWNDRRPCGSHGDQQTRNRQRFTSRYRVTDLMYFETYSRPQDANAREKEIKGWRRAKKLALIKSMNPELEDLAAVLEDG